MVVVRDVVQHNTLSVVESNMELSSAMRLCGEYFEILPLDLATTEFVTDSLRLNDLKRLKILSHITVFLGDESREILTDLALGNWTANFGDINGNDFAILGVDDRAKVERKGILIVHKRRAIIHERLLKSDFVTPRVRYIHPKRLYHRSS
jgi:hypothetical protein